MSQAGLFAGKSTQDAPTNGALTSMQSGYHWFEWTKAIPTSAEFDATKGVAATQDTYWTTGSGINFPHPFVGQEFTEWTISTVFKSNSVPTAGNNRREPCGINAPGGVEMKDNSGDPALTASVWSQPDGTSNFQLANHFMELPVGWSALDWYCVTISYSQPLNVGMVSYVNMTNGLELFYALTIVNNDVVSYTGATAGKFPTVATYGAKAVAGINPDTFSSPWQGSLGHLYVHNSYIDLSDEGNRRKFSGIDGIINLGGVGQNPFGVQPLIYLPNGGPWDSRGTANTGVYPDDFFVTLPVELDVNLPPVSS